MKKEISQKKETQQKEKKSVHNVEVEEAFERLNFDVVTQSDHQKYDDSDIKVKFDLKLPDNKLAYLTHKMDTGAQGNILPLRTFRNIFQNI